MRKFIGMLIVAVAAISTSVLPAAASRCGGSPVWKALQSSIYLKVASVEKDLLFLDRMRVKSYLDSLETVTVGNTQIAALENIALVLKPYVSSAEYKELRGDVNDMIGRAYAIMYEHNGSLLLADLSLENDQQSSIQ